MNVKKDVIVRASLRENLAHAPLCEMLPLKIQVTTLAPGSQPVLVEVEPFETVGNLKLRLESQFEIPAGFQRLLWNGVDLPSHRPVQRPLRDTLPDGVLLQLHDSRKGSIARRARRPPSPGVDSICSPGVDSICSSAFDRTAP